MLMRLVPEGNSSRRRPLGAAGAIGLATLVVAISLTPAPGRDASGNFQVYGAGFVPCTTFVELVAKAKQNMNAETSRIAYLSWVQGYLTPYNIDMPGVVSVLRTPDATALSEWLVTYCKVHPSDNLVQVMPALISDLGRKPPAL